MEYKLEDIGKYGFVPVGSIQKMILESIRQLAALNMSRREIADTLELSYNTVCNYIVKFSIPMPDSRAGGRVLAKRTIKEFFDLTEEGYTLTDIAGFWGCTDRTLLDWRKERGIALAPRKPAKLRKREGVVR